MMGEVELIYNTSASDEQEDQQDRPSPLISTKGFITFCRHNTSSNKLLVRIIAVLKFC